MVREIPFIQWETYAELYLYGPNYYMNCYCIGQTTVKRAGISSDSSIAQISTEKNYMKYEGQNIDRMPPVVIEETVPNCSRTDPDPRPRFIYTLRKFKEFLEELGPMDVVEIHLPWGHDLEKGKIDLVSMAKEVFGEGSLGSAQFLRIHTFSLQQPFVPYLLENFDYKCFHVQSEGPLTITEKMMNCEFLSIRATLTNPEILNEFTGTGLMVRNGDENGLSSDFIMEIIKKWYQHNNPITEYAYLGHTHWTPESSAFYEENKVEEWEYYRGNELNKKAIFIREDGEKCMMVRGIPFIEPETYAELYLYSPYYETRCYYMTPTDVKRMTISSVSNRAEISIEKNYMKYQGQNIDRIPPVEIKETVPNCSADQDPNPRIFYTLRKFKEFLEEAGPLQVVEIHLPWEDALQKGKIDLVSMAKQVFGEGSLGSAQFLRIHTFSLQQPFVPYLLENFDYKCIHVETEGPLTITEKMMNCEFLSIRATLTNPEILNEFTGTGLMIRNGDENGFSSDFIMDIIKKWHQHDSPITEYVYIGRTHWTPEFNKFYEENKAEEKLYNTGSQPNKEAIFIRDDGTKCMVHNTLMSSKDHIELWFEPFDDEALSKIGSLIQPNS